MRASVRACVRACARARACVCVCVCVCVRACVQHFDQFDQQWGAFGGGAPKDRVVRKKVNLDNALYHLDRQVSINEFLRDIFNRELNDENMQCIV